MLPLLNSQWNQGVYYNESCPVDSAGPDNRTLTGCVATALGQLMYYFRYPQHGTGFYTSEYTVYGTHSVDYEHSEYNWEQMPLRLTRSNRDVSTLLYHIGVSVDMNYGPDGSGMWNHKAAHTLKTFFGYSQDTQYNFRDTTTMNWNAILIDHLDRSIPLYYAGWADSVYESGHAFICDGYQDSVFFHFNWGWGGNWDGFYHIDNLIIGGSDFTTMHEMIMNAVPGGSYPYECQGRDTLISLDGTIDDGSGPLNEYQSNASCSWLIAPIDSVSKITLNFVQFDTELGKDFVYIYNGKDETAPLLGKFSGNTIPQSLSSSGKYLYIRFDTDGGNNDKGFLLTYSASLIKNCNSLTTLTAYTDTITDGSGKYNYQNSLFCRWRIEPPDAEMITIHFSEFNLAPDDNLLITDLNSSNAIVANLTGTQLPLPITIQSGNIMLRFLSGNTGNSSGFKLIYNASATVMNEIYFQNVKVYPVPASDVVNLHIESNESKQLNITILSTDGRAILNKNFTVSGETITLDVRDLPEGIYIVEILQTEGFRKYCKIIKRT